LQYGTNYTVEWTFANGGYSNYTTVSKTASFPTSVSSSLQYSYNCTVNYGYYYLTTGSSSRQFPEGTLFTLTGPAGFGTKTYTATTSGYYLYTNSFENSYIYPPGSYTLTVDMGCGTPIVQTFDWSGIYNYNNLGHTDTLTCGGLKVTPTGQMTYLGSNTDTYFRIISGPVGYDQSAITPGQWWTFSAPGQYIIGIMNTNSTSGCAIGTDTIVYTAPPMTLDKTATGAYVCVGGTVGNIFLKAINGVDPYTYELYDKDNVVKLVSSSITTSGRAYFSYGDADSTYTVRVYDDCGNNFSQKITLAKLQTAKIVYSDATDVCYDGTMYLNALTLGTTTYNWTGPNGYTSTSQFPVINNVTEANEGWYYVSVSPEMCGTPVRDSIFMTVTPPFAIDISGDSIVCVREFATLTAIASGGGGTYSYQWQQSTNGGTTWNNYTETGATTAIANINRSITSTAYVQYRYRCIVTDNVCGARNSKDIGITYEPCYLRVNPQIRSRSDKEEILNR
jgi:hypothetical protein